MTIKPWLPSKAEERRHLWKISGPLIAAYLADIGMLITDMIIVGRLGGVELAAVGLGGDGFYVLLLIGIGILSIVGVLIAQSLGADTPEKVIPYVRQGLLVATVVSVPISILSWYLSPLLEFTSQDPEVLLRMDEYLRPLTLSVWPVLIFTVFRNYLTAIEKTGVILTLTLLALALNVIFNVILVHGLLGFPALGVAGAGWGTSLVNWIVLFLLIAHIGRHHLRMRDVFTKQLNEWQQRKEIIVLGLPIAISHILGGGMFTVAAVLMGTFSADHLAAQQLIYTLIYITISVTIGFGDAVKVRIAYGLGKKSPEAIKQSFIQSVWITIIMCAVFASILWFFPSLLIRVFLNVDDPGNLQIVGLVVMIASYAGIFQLLDGLNVVLGSALRGLRDTQTPMWTMAACYWGVGLGLAVFFAFYLNQGGLGIWRGMLMGVLTGSVIMWWRFYVQLDKLHAIAKT